MDKKQDKVVEEDVIMMTEVDNDAVSRILERAMPEGIDTEAKINEILGIQQ